MKNKQRVFLSSLEEYFRDAELDDILENTDGSVLIVGETSSTDFGSISSKGNADLILLKIK